jgi:hypothetical protein
MMLSLVEHLFDHSDANVGFFEKFATNDIQSDLQHHREWRG